MKSIITSFKSIKSNGFLLSSSLHKQVDAANENLVTLGSLLCRKLNRQDLGKEVGSINYVNGSNVFFIKTKALQDYSFLPILNPESTESIMPQAFIEHNLRAGDIILSKDGNIGETIILDKDYPNYMLSGALYKLPLYECNKYYILACIKHSYFREQLNRMVPRGATLRHAGTKFLNCLIPFPTNNAEAIVEYVSIITKKVIDIEIELKNKYAAINHLIETEILKNQQCNTMYKFSHATYSKIVVGKRLDTGTYSDTFQRITHLVNNYKYGVFHIDANKLKSGSTPKIRIISDSKGDGVKWITPTNCSDWGYIRNHEQIATPTKNNLENDAVLLINRTSRGGNGEYVGIGAFYDYNVYGKGHHNQGIYRVSGYDKDLLVFITCFMNTPMMRKYCSALSVGSKMKEIKSEQFLSIPIPKLDKRVSDNVYQLFYTEEFKTDRSDIMMMRPERTGLFQLNIAKDILTNYLNSVLDKITNNSDVPIWKIK